jgi:hypothetical protein
MFKLEISTDNDAFNDRPSSELARMLHALARHIERGDVGAFKTGGTLHDANGNPCGKWSVE